MNDISVVVRYYRVIMIMSRLTPAFTGASGGEDGGRKRQGALHGENVLQAPLAAAAAAALDEEHRPSRAPAIHQVSCAFVFCFSKAAVSDSMNILYTLLHPVIWQVSSSGSSSNILSRLAAVTPYI